MSNEKLQQVLKNQRAQQNEPEENLEDDIVQLVGFMVGNEEFAVPILNIQEIIKPIDSTRVPSTPGYVVGVFNLRGSVIPLIDLRQKFGYPKQKVSDETRFIVIKNDEQILGFIIDKLTEAIRLSKANIDPVPESMMNDEDNHIYGVGKKEEKIITILNVDAIMKPYRASNSDIFAS
jgi:purine-binding chemotaxis protein CheW